MQLLHDHCASASCSRESARPTLRRMTNSHTPSAPRLAFIGGGNMASAILGGLLRSGQPADRVLVVEPHAPQAEVVREKFGVAVLSAGGPELAGAGGGGW